MPTLQEAFDRFVQVDRSSFTNKQYSNLLLRMVKAIGPVRDVRRVSAEDVEDWFYPVINTKPLMRSTAAEYLRVVQRFFNFCQKRGYIKTTPAETLRVRHDEEEPHESTPIPPSDLRKIVEYARVTSPRNYAILLFFLASGCRTGGITSLTMPNLDLERQRAKLKEKGSRWVYVYFGAVTTEALRVWLEQRPTACVDEYVFTTTGRRKAKGLSRYAFRAIVESISLKACGYMFRPHKLRHSRGHSLAWRGVPITAASGVLNHKSIKSTGYYYPNDQATTQALVRRYELAALEDAEALEKLITLVS
ncbi:MAG: site-specific integrase [Chloroflexota bacterium]